MYLIFLLSKPQYLFGLFYHNLNACVWLLEIDILIHCEGVAEFGGLDDGRGLTVGSGVWAGAV